MSKRLYVDANVLVSLWKWKQIGRGGLLPASHYAEQLVERALACEYEFVTAALTFEEVEKKYAYFQENVQQIAARLERAGKLALIPQTQEDEAAGVALNAHLRLGWKDCTHLLIAEKTSDCLVTWDAALLSAAAARGVKAARPSELL